MPIMGRLTIDGKFVQFSTKLYITPTQWNQMAQRANVGRNYASEATEINNRLSYITSRLQEIYRELGKHDLYVSAEKVRNYFLGHTIGDHTLLGLFKKHLEDMSQSVGITVSPATYNKCDRTYRHLRDFLESERHLSDIALVEINHMFIKDWERYLRTVKGCAANTTAKFMQGFRTIIIMARNNGWIVADPFANYKIRFERVDRGFLTKTELQAVMQKKFSCDRLTHVRDIFIFSCFTGLAYIDVKSLKEDDIQTGFDGRLWIVHKRIKTNVEENVPLLGIPQAILLKYKGKQPLGFALPVLSNQKMNAYLKEIGDLCGIKKEMTFHTSRHTFATNALSHGMPVESLAKMLGHSNIKTTQIYAKITDHKLNQDMENLEKVIL